jgi:hypothetical protein
MQGSARMAVTPGFLFAGPFTRVWHSAPISGSVHNAGFAAEFTSIFLNAK